jgi:hypothetical protein
MSGGGLQDGTILISSQLTAESRQGKIVVLEPSKTQIPSTKLQTNSKFQYQITETGLVRRRRIGHCDLFEICHLLFGFFSPNIPESFNQVTSVVYRPEALAGSG